jgi:hypothetical protein
MRSRTGRTSGATQAPRVEHGAPAPHQLRTGLHSYTPAPLAPLPGWLRPVPLLLVPMALAVDLSTGEAVTSDVLLALSSVGAACLYSQRAPPSSWRG